MMSERPDVLMIGAGEYTIGLPPDTSNATSATSSDKKLGVVALTFLHLRKLGKVGKVGLVATSVEKATKAQKWLHEGVGKTFRNIPSDLDFVYPTNSGVRSNEIYKEAIASMKPGSIVTIFTPDSTHFEMAECAIKRGLHVMVAKPPVVSRQQHQGLIELARKHGVLCCVEFHKRFDPIYEDARNQISNLERFGHVSYFYAYMSQPKYQLETFKHWVAEKKSDISFYLNSHHIDMLLWCLNNKAVPVSVYASESTGIADECINSKDVLDTISLLVKFKYLNSAHTFHAVFTSSWVAPKAEVHSQQKFQCLGSKAEVRVDQAHRGYELSSDATGYTSKNPLYMNFTPDSKGNFIGVNGYGYKSFSVFAEACTLLNSKRASLDESGTVLTDSDVIGFDSLCSIQSSLFVTSILEAGAISLKEKKPIEI